MWSIFRQTVIRSVKSTHSWCKETKRYAGHSKWANIRHIKAQKDGERSNLFAKMSRQMRVAIAEVGSSKPADNPKLAQIIQLAKKKNMPMASINNVLEKASKTAANTQTLKLDIRGPGGCIIVIELITDNLKGLRPLLNTVMRKNRSTIIEPNARHVFHHKGFIVTDSKESVNAATEDAITVGAEDVEEIEVDGQKCFQFICQADLLPKVSNQLASRGYNIITAEDRYLPHIHAHLSDEDIARAEQLYSKLEAFDEVFRIHDNIA